jgi:hypothetical protein
VPTPTEGPLAGARVVQQVAHRASELEVPSEPPTAGEVEDGCAGRVDFARPWPVVLAEQCHPNLAERPLAEVLPEQHEQRIGRHVVEVGAILVELAASDLTADLERIAASEIRARFNLEPLDDSPSTIPEEEEVGLRRDPR